MPFKDADQKKEWMRSWRKINPKERAHEEAFLGSLARKEDLEQILHRKLTWKEFKLYDAGIAIAPDVNPRYAGPGR